MTRNQQGFSMIEALVSVAIVAIGFAGVYALVGVSDRALRNSFDREQLNYQANEFIETLNSEHASEVDIVQYHEKKLTQCDALSLKKVSATDEKLGNKERLIRLCKRIKETVGESGTGDRRRIRVVKKTPDSKDVYVVSVELSSKDGKNSVGVKRVFNVR